MTLNHLIIDGCFPACYQAIGQLCSIERSQYCVICCPYFKRIYFSDTARGGLNSLKQWSFLTCEVQPFALDRYNFAKCKSLYCKIFANIPVICCNLSFLLILLNNVLFTHRKILNLKILNLTSFFNQNNFACLKIRESFVTVAFLAYFDWFNQFVQIDYPPKNSVR